MAVSLQTVRELLESEDWEGCAHHATRALASGGWQRTEQAFLHFARAKSLSNLDRYTQALEPGQFAVYLAEEIGDYDLLGRSLLELAWIQHKLAGMEHLAISTQKRFFAIFPRLKDKALRDSYCSAQLNLGTYLRASGQYQQALDQFRLAYQEARKRGESKVAERSRSSAVWEALRLGYLADAQALLKAAEETDDPRLKAGNLLDEAQLAYLQGKMQVACSLALRASTLTKGLPDLFSRALDILQRVADKAGDPETAMAAAIVAKLQAEENNRHDLVAQLKASISNLALRSPEAVKSLMSTIDGA